MDRHREIQGESFYNKANIMKNLSLISENKDKVESAYVYGSYIREDSSPDDIDLFVIARKDTLTGLCDSLANKNIYKGLDIDWNVSTLEEFRERVHVNRPPSYFVGLKKEANLVYGTDYLQEVRDEEVTKKEIHRRIKSLCQRARHSYINSRNKKFWNKKLEKWSLAVVSELLFLEGQLELDYEVSVKKYIGRKPENRKFLKPLLERSTTIREKWLILEKLSDSI